MRDAPSSAFTYLANPARVLFGRGRLGELAAEIAALGRRRALLIATPEQRAFVEGVAAGLGHSCVGVFAGAAMHTPSDVTDAALAMLNAVEADVLVALGGGSTIGLGKALALRTTLPLIAVPTTYAGSEMTRILGETSAGRKTTISSDIVLPKVVIYDVELTLTLPVPLSVVSGFNAIAHAAEALYAGNANPIVSLLAEEGIGALAAGLSGLKAEPRGIAARSQAQYGAWLCGTCLGSAGMALHHKICHVLGGTFGLPHAETHTVMLAHVMAYNAAAAPDAMARLARALGTDDAAQGLHALAVALDAPLSLAGLGMSADGLDLATELALKDAYWNPRPLEAIAIKAMLQRAHAGDRPLVT